jgi:hypothetical protein
MALDEQDIEEFIVRLHDDPQLRDRVRNAILSDDFLALPGIVRQLGERVDQLGARVDQLGERIDQLAERMAAVDVQLSRLAQNVDALTTAQHNFEQQMARVDGRLGNLEGWQFEERYVRNIGARLGRYFRRPQAVSLGDLDTVFEALQRGDISDKDWDDLKLIDVIAFGGDRSAGDAQVYLAAELSIVVDEADVERAERRAAILRRAGLEVIPIVDGDTILPKAASLAQEKGVRHWLRTVA